MWPRGMFFEAILVLSNPDVELSNCGGTRNLDYDTMNSVNVSQQACM